MRRGLMVTAVLLASLGAACGGDDDGGSSGVDQDMVDLIVEQGETEEVATCFAKELEDYSADEIRAFVESGEEPDEKLLAALEAAGEKCDE